VGLAALPQGMGVTYVNEAFFALSFILKSPNLQHVGQSSQETLMRVVYPLPDTGISIFDMAWEWAVYYV